MRTRVEQCLGLASPLRRPAVADAEATLTQWCFGQILYPSEATLRGRDFEELGGPERWPQLKNESLTLSPRTVGRGQGSGGENALREHDLGDSLDTVELVMELEEEFDINIPDDAAEKIPERSARRSIYPSGSGRRRALSLAALRSPNVPLPRPAKRRTSVLQARIPGDLHRFSMKRSRRHNRARRDQPAGLTISELFGFASAMAASAASKTTTSRIFARGSAEKS